MEAGVKPVWAGSAGDRYGRGAISSWPIVMILVKGAESHAIVISEAILYYTAHMYCHGKSQQFYVAYQVLVWPGG